MDNIKDILGKAFEISTSKEYTVKFFKDIELIEVKKLTYLQLGTILVSNHPIIKEVYIIYKNRVD